MRSPGHSKERETKIETESLLIAAQNNAIRTNYVKAKISITQENSMWEFFGDRHETINHLISGCSKLAQNESKTRQKWVLVSNPQWIVQEIEIWAYDQIVYARKRIYPH